MAQIEFARYNDGVAAIYREKDKRSNFAAKINASALDDLDRIAKLDYQEMSKRQSDLEFAESMQFSLDLKIRTRYIKGVDNKCKVVIDGYLYDVSYIDPTRTEIYWYLQGVDKLASKD